MSKARNTGNLNNSIQISDTGNITFVSGSTTLLAISSSGAVTTTGVISGSNALSASFAATASFVTLSQTASFVANAQSASNAVSAITASSADNFLVRNTLTAQTIVVQTITSSVDFVTGSTQFGSKNNDVHTYTGSLAISGSSTVGLNVNAGALFVSSSGRVGIGTTNPQPRFHVAGLTGGATPGATGIPSLGFANSSSISLFTNLDTNYGTLFGTLNTGVGWIQQQRVDGTGTAYNLLLQPNGGNIGIGTTNPVTTNLVGSLTIVKSYSGDTPTSTTAQIYYTNQSNLFLFGRNAGITMVGNNSEECIIAFANASSPYIGGIRYSTGATAVGGDMIFQTSGSTERLRITSDGNIGIGTTSPNSYLDIIDENGGQQMFRIRNYSVAATGNFTGNYMVELRAATTPGAISGSLLVHTQETNDNRPTMDVSDANGVFTRFVNSKVGIGTTNPLTRVHILGSTGADLIRFDGGVNTKFLFKITGASDDPFTLRRNHPSGGDLDIMSWTYTGKVGIGLTTPSATFHNKGSFITENSNSRYYGEAKTFIFQSAFSNPTISLITINSTSSYGAVMIRVTVYQNSVSQAKSNIHVGYANWAADPYPTISKGITAPTIQASFNSGNNVGTLAWSGNTLQYTGNRMTNYDGYTIVVEWGANTDHNAAPTYGGELQ